MWARVRDVVYKKRVLLPGDQQLFLLIPILTSIYQVLPTTPVHSPLPATMKASSIFSVATLAISAMASPILDGLLNKPSNAVAETGNAPEINNSGDIVTLLESTLKGVKEHTGAMSMFNSTTLALINSY